MRTCPAARRRPLLSALGLLTAMAAMQCPPARADAKNNILTTGVTAEPYTLDPAMGLSGNDYPFLYTIFDRLLTFDPKTLEPRPGLAESWEFTGADKLTFRLKLKPNLKFQDGTVLDAEAVKASLVHFQTGGRIHDLDVVKSIDVADPLTVELRLERPFSPLTAVLADRAGMISSPTAIKKYGRDYDRHPVGAGAFTLKQWNAGSSLEFVKFPDYRDKQNIKLAGVTFKIIGNGTSLISAAITGQVDYAYNLESKSLAALQASPRVRVAIEPSLQYNMINVNAGYPPVDNELVRRAGSDVDRSRGAGGDFAGRRERGRDDQPSGPAVELCIRSALRGLLQIRSGQGQTTARRGGIPQWCDVEDLRQSESRRHGHRHDGHRARDHEDRGDHARRRRANGLGLRAGVQFAPRVSGLAGRLLRSSASLHDV